MALQLRRGTDAERKLVTFAVGELIYTTDTKKVFVGDGTTLGGKFVGGLAEAGLRAVTTFNGVEFVTTYEPEYTAAGHILMDGKDLAGINKLSVDRVDSSLVPTSSLSTLGTPANPWGSLQVGTINASSAINGPTNGTHNGPTIGVHTGQVNGELRGNVVGDSGRVLVNWQSDSFDGIFQGPLYGSVYGADSTVMLDSLNRVLNLTPQTSAPPGATVGAIAVADGNTTGWDPKGTNAGVAYPVFYNGTAWVAMTA